MDQFTPSKTAGEIDGAADDESLAGPVVIARVENLLRAFATTLRSFRLYAGNGPMLDRFGETLREKFDALWEIQPSLTLRVTEKQILFDGKIVFPTAGEGGDLPFLLYKDGIRELTISRGFEDEEIKAFLAVIAHAPQIRPDEDDLITLLWDADLSFLKYDYVEPAGDSDEAGPAVKTGPETVSAEAVRSDAAAPAEPTAVTPEDFKEALYFLDEAELRRLADEVRREEERDLWPDVINALFDRLEDGSNDRQKRVINIFAELLPSLLAAGRAAEAAELLGDLVELAGRGDVFSPDVLRDVRALFAQLGEPETVQQLITMLELSPSGDSGEGLAALLAYFPPEAIAPLMRASETAPRPDIRRTLNQLIARLATGNRDHVMALLSDGDPMVAAGAARWVGRLGTGAAVTPLTSLLSSPEPTVRLAAIESLRELRASAVAVSIVPLLNDSDASVRIAAARALGTLGFAGARKPLQEVLGSKYLRTADRTEKVAMFEAFGRLAGAEGVALLDQTLNRKSWLGRAESSETRACAAIALAQIRTPAAQEALVSAIEDNDPVVRTAVNRALKEVKQ